MATKLNGKVDNSVEPGQSGLGKMIGLGTAVAGAITGDPAMIAQGTGAMTSQTPFGKVAAGVGAGLSLAKDVSKAGQTLQNPTVDDAMTRRIQSDPMQNIHNGLMAANDPNLPLDYETRMSVIEPLLRAKHFGYGGGMDSQNA